MKELQSSLPSNSTSQPIISVILTVTETLLISDNGNLTNGWMMNQQLMMALSDLFQGNVSLVDLTSAGVDLNQLLGALSPLIPPNERAFLSVAKQESQILNSILQLASAAGGFQNQNFSEAIISSIRVLLDSLSNEIGTLPQNVIEDFLGAVNDSLQLILNTNMSYAQLTNLTQETIQILEGGIRALLPEESHEVLVSIHNIILRYLANISEPAGFNQWNEIIIDMMKELQSSLPSNSTAQPIISVILTVTKTLLISENGNLTNEWMNQQLMMALSELFQGNVSLVDLTSAGVDLNQLLEALSPLIPPEDRAFLSVVEQVSQTLTYALQLASTNGDLQSQNFSEAIISSIRVLLDSLSNETGTLPQNVIESFLGALKGSLQLILNPNMSYAQLRNLTQETIQMSVRAIDDLLPAEAA
ncbi:hypothetical protein DNTS_022605, partial [Danionella cerebrum]